MAKSKETKYKFLSAILLIAVLFLAVYAFYPNTYFTVAGPLILPQLSTSGFVQANISASIIDQNTANLSLTAGCYDLSAGVEPFQAQSVEDGLNNVVGPRPNAHDLAKDVFTALKINVLMTEITEQHDNMFFAKIILRQGNTVLNYDVRPSDGIAIAVRMHAPVYINETLLRQVGKKVC